MDFRLFLEENYTNFNAGTLVDAVKAYQDFIDGGGKMLLTMAGAMSTSGIGRLLSRAIRRGYVHAICCTGANLEEDLFRAVAPNEYKRFPEWRYIKPEEDKMLHDLGMNRVTDTAVPEAEAVRKIEKIIFEKWKENSNEYDQCCDVEYPHEYVLSVTRDLSKDIDCDFSASWLKACLDENIPVFVPGWADSTLGNIFASYCMGGKINPAVMKSDVHYMMALAQWYEDSQSNSSIGFFQIGGGIAGDFPICVVPMLNQDSGKKVNKWGYFCQVSDSTTSYGSYSGALPTEKISWGKLEVNTPQFVIESDATIVMPLILSYLLER